MFKHLVAGILAWALLLPAPAAAGLLDVPMAENLQAEGRNAERGKMPILLLFASAFCPYCEQVRNEYLGPMVKDPAWRDKVIIRQIEAGSDRELIGFDGRKTTHGAYAAGQKIRMVPTIKVVDGQGRELANPIIGFLIPDFYFGYIQDAIEQGQQKMRQGSGGR